MDTCKLGPGLYQYTSIDDCTRYRVLRIYKRRTAANTLDFLTEPYRVCRRVNILRDYPDDKIKIYPRN